MCRSNLFRCLIVLSIATSGANAFAGHHPPGYWQMPGVHVPKSYHQAPIVDHYVGQKPQVWDPQQPIEKLLTDVTQRSWLRVDYLHWNLGRPGSLNIGAPVLNETDPLVVFDNITGTSAGEAIIPNMGNMALDDSSGIRGTWGLDLANADFELEFFGTEQNHDGFAITNIAAGRDAGAERVGTSAKPNVVTPLLTSGSPQDAATANYLIYDSSFQTTLTSQIWGAEATLLTKPYLPGPGVSLQWLGGFRYVVHEGEFRNRGVSNGGGLLADTVTTFGGTTTNNIYGPEAGFRLQAENKWFTFSATPRIAFALNDYTAITSAAPLGQPETISSGSDIEFTPIVQVSFTGEIHLTPNFSLFGGYDFMWIYRMTQPYDNIVYDSEPGLAGGFTPNIYQDIDLESFYARGLSFGAVLRY